MGIHFLFCNKLIRAYSNFNNEQLDSFLAQFRYPRDRNVSLTYEIDNCILYTLEYYQHDTPIYLNLGVLVAYFEPCC